MPILKLSGVVESGRKLGRTLGFPTANIAIDPNIAIEIGVYLSRVEVDGVWRDSVTNVGTNPTVGGNALRSESYIFDFDDDLYGEQITIDLICRLRGEMRFDSIEALQHQIESDVAHAQELHTTYRSKKAGI